MHDPEVQVSPALLHGSAVPHLQTPLVQVSDVPLQADTVAEHLQTLFVASQYDPAVFPTQVEAVPHLHSPEEHVSPEFVQVNTVAEHLH